MDSKKLRRKLMLRRLSISAPTLSVRAHTPWWAKGIGIFFGLTLAAAVGAWLYDLGSDFAGFNKDEVANQMVRLKAENKNLNDDRDKLLKTAVSAEAKLSIEKATQEQLSKQIKQLEQDNTALKADLAFFETLLPTSQGQEGLAIRNLTVNLSADKKAVETKMLLMQGGKKPAQFTGKLVITLAGTQAGKPYTLNFPDDSSEAAAATVVNLSRYQRLENMINLPDLPNLQIKNVTVKIMQGTTIKFTQTAPLRG